MNLSTSDSAPPTKRALASAELREQLLTAAMVEFAKHGYEGASTRAIAARAGAHQPQINYHFDSKDALWRAVFERLLGELDVLLAAEQGRVQAPTARNLMAATIRALVVFAARRPELNRMMLHEGTNPSERLDWLVATHVNERAALLRASWRELVESGEAAPIPDTLVYHLLIGSSTLLHANAPEFRLLIGADPSSDEVVDAHAEALIAMFLPTTKDL